MAVETSTREALAFYLEGHLAGAESAVQSARRSASGDVGSELGGFLSQLAREIDEDKNVLQELMDRLGITPSATKNAIARGGEWFSKLMLEARSGSETSIGEFTQLEMLSLGVEGKICLWEALSAVAPSHPELAEVDFARLLDRAQEQREGLERHRLQAARQALA